MFIGLTQRLGRQRRRKVRGGSLIGAALAITLITAAPAAANSIDRTNPQQTGCANSGYRVGYNNLIDGGGQIVGRVELRYSRVCRTNWALVFSYVGSQPLLTYSYRVSDGLSTLGSGGDPGPFTGTSAYSDQLYGYNTTVCAYGAVQGVSYWNGFCA